MNIIRARKADLVRVFGVALDQCAKALDESIAEGRITTADIPTVVIPTNFTFSNKLEICVTPEFDLRKPIPDPPV